MGPDLFTSVLIVGPPVGPRLRVTSSGNRCIEHLGSWTLMAKALRIEIHLPPTMHIDTHMRACECAHTLNAHASVRMCGSMP